MPNWCETTYKCVGDPKEVRSLYGKLKSLEKRKAPKAESDFGKLWLGCLVEALGYDWQDYSCRGEILDYHMRKGVLTIYQQTAWYEQEGVREVIEKTYPHIKVYFLNMEPGMVIYDTNDYDHDYFTERYFIDNIDGGESFNTLDEAAKYVSGKIGRKVETVDEIQQGISQYLKEHSDNEDLWMSFHEIEDAEE